MEARDEAERREGKVLPRDLPPITAEQFALQALIDHLGDREVRDETASE